MEIKLHCPVCRARFRGTTSCTRCGAELGPLMRLVAEAWQARNRAREALERGDLSAAGSWIDRAELLHSTQIGSTLRGISRLLQGVQPDDIVAL